MSAHEPIEEIGCLRTPGEDRSLVPGEDAAADALLTRLVQLPVRARRRQRVRTVLLAALAIAGAGTTASHLLRRAPSDLMAVACRGSADVPDADIVGLPAAPDLESGERCGPVRTDGPLGVGAPPQPVACVASGRAFAWLPGDTTTCAAVGWTLAAATGDESDGSAPPATTRLADALVARFVDHCFDEGQATAAVEAALAEAGLPDWTVNPLAAPGDGCITPAPDLDTRSVDLIPSRRRTESRPGRRLPADGYSCRRGACGGGDWGDIHGSYRHRRTGTVRRRARGYALDRPHDSRIEQT